MGAGTHFNEGRSKLSPKTACSVCTICLCSPQPVAVSLLTSPMQNTSELFRSAVGYDVPSCASMSDVLNGLIAFIQFGL